MNNWKPIDRTKEYGHKTDFIKTSEIPNEPIKHFTENCNLTTCRCNENGKCTEDTLCSGMGSIKALEKIGVKCDKRKVWTVINGKAFVIDE